MHQAVAEGDIVQIRALLKKKVDINALDSRHWSPLHVGCSERQFATCQFLITRGADVLATTLNNSTPLHILCSILDDSVDYYEIFEQIIQKGANVNFPQIQGYTPLHEAALKGSVKVAKLLLKRKAKINARAWYIPFLLLLFLTPFLSPISLSLFPYSFPLLLFPYSFPLPYLPFTISSFLSFAAISLLLSFTLSPFPFVFIPFSLFPYFLRSFPYFPFSLSMQIPFPSLLPRSI